MRFKKSLLSAALALTVSTSVHAFEFSNVYILGDSLSDAGQYGARFTTNPGLTASEYLAQRYGFTVRPSTQGGTAHITVTASDGKGGTATSTFTVTLPVGQLA